MVPISHNSLAINQSKPFWMVFEVNGRWNKPMPKMRARVDEHARVKMIPTGPLGAQETSPGKGSKPFTLLVDF